MDPTLLLKAGSNTDRQKLDWTSRSGCLDQIRIRLLVKKNRFRFRIKHEEANLLYYSVVQGGRPAQRETLGEDPAPVGRLSTFPSPLMFQLK